jgi:type I restriction enzyme R subunit
MQTIARANRVFGDKNNGLIVDYIGIFRYLEKALAIYATGADAEGNQKPIADKSKLVERLREAIAEISEFCEGLGIDLATAQTDDALQNINQIRDAMERILINDETKRNYLQVATNVTKLYKAILPDPDAHAFTRTCQLIHIIAQKIKNLTPPADISGVMTKVEDLLDRSIAPEGFLIQIPSDSYGTEQIDLSQIDFERLSEQFQTEHKRVEAERLRGAINGKLAAMIRLNRSRMDYQQKFEQMIAEYNAGTIGVDDYVQGLFAFAGELNQEDQRAGTEEFSEEELAVFDLLTQREPHLTVPERDEVKTAVRKLLKTLKQEKLVLDWRKRTQSKAEVKETVDNILDDKLPQPYTLELFNQKSEAVYQHIYDSYYGEGKSIYTEN